jgi:hypothetical protein
LRHRSYCRLVAIALHGHLNDARDAVIWKADELELDATGKHWSGEPVSLRSMLLTVLLDTTRHAGQSDIVRELIDGTTGDCNSPSGFYGATDDEYRSKYLARVRGEIDTPA